MVSITEFIKRLSHHWLLEVCYFFLRSYDRAS